MYRYLKNIKNEKGITIITLAVTIIVMLILAGVAINSGIGEDGIIGKAENAVDKYQEVAQNEKESLDNISEQIENILDDVENPIEDIEESPVIKITNWNSVGGIVTLEVKEGYKAEYQIEGEEWSNYTEGSQIEVQNGKKISVRYYTEEGIKGKIASKIIKDEIAPNIEVSIEEQTNNAIKVKATAEDGQMGIDEELGYKYYIRKTGESDYEYKGGNKEGEYEYTNLEPKTNYDILVTANDLGGNTGSGKTEGITEEGEAPTLIEGENIIITKTPEEITKENVIVKAELIGIDSNCYIEYSEGNINNYVRYNNQIEVENNETIYVRINDGEKASNAIQVNIDNIDKELPQVQVTLGSKTSNSITVNIEVTDNVGEEEGQEYVYKIKKTTETNYTQSYTSTNKTYVFINLTQNTGYDIEVEAKDKVGNVGKGNILNQVTNEVTSGLEEGAITFTNPSWTNGQASIQVSTNTSYQIEYQKNNTTGSWTKIDNNGTISGLNHNDTVYARLTDGINSGEHASTSIKDTIQPEVSIRLGTITSNSIGVTVTATDKETGLATSNTYEYFLNNSSQGASTSNTHTFSNLFDGTKYTLKVKVTDKAGNSKETTVEGTTNKVPSGIEQGAITFTSPTWSNGTASIKVSTNTSYQIEYQKNGTTGSWTKIASGGTISGLSHNTTVYARLTDGVNAGEYASSSIKDTVAPTVSISTSALTSTSVKLTVTASDGQSGLADSGRYTYYLNSTQKASNNTNSYTYTGLTANTSYTLKVAVKDKAGKVAEKSTTVKTKQETVSDGITSGKTYTKNTVIYDSYNNPVKVPAGFKIASDSGKNVTEGVVIEDVSAGDSNTKGNQYVWVPIGNVKYNTSGAAKTINFGRYDFESNSAGVMKQSADNYTSTVTIELNYQELTSSNKGNIVAKNLGDFITKAKNSGGYYIGRYEAGKVSGNTNTFNIKKGQEVYNNIAQSNAANLARNLYSSNNNFESDLINSYAYDTAIVFIQTFSGDTDYSQQIRLQTTQTTTGTSHDSNNNYDVRCNIYDMAGNVKEWSTETSTRSTYPCVNRGGCYDNSDYYTAYRLSASTSTKPFTSGFRSTLYL